MPNRVVNRLKNPPSYLIVIGRIIVGAVFIVSGFSKMIDPWGFFFKIEEYLMTWGWNIPRTIVLTGALALSSFEFICGALMIFGCYRRVVPRLMLALMAFMLPLTFYIWIKNPVSDCGCFGDFWVLSNFWTFAKNVFITALLIWLIIVNKNVRPLFKPAIQWLVVVALGIYILAIGLLSYLVQPLIDFRPYPEGKSIIEDENGQENLIFVYEKNGERRTFGMDELPDESWTFISREGEVENDESLTIFDAETGDDVTEEVLTDSDKLLVLVMSEPARADLSDTYVINELADAIKSQGGQMIALMATGIDGIEEWKNLSMAEYPCYMADDTQLKELVRGIMAMVYIEDGIIKWKRTINTIDLADIEAVTSGEKDFNLLKFNSKSALYKLTITILSLLSVMWIMQSAVDIIVHHRRKRKSLDQQGEKLEKLN